MITLGVLPGDGIGPEVVAAAVRVTEAAVGDVTWRELPIGAAAIDTHGTPLPESTLAQLEHLDGWLLGPHDNASYPAGFPAPGGMIRKRFDLFANIRPARALGVPAACPGMDLVIVRENTEGFYADRNMYAGSGEFMPTPDVALAVAVFTRRACERIAHEAFRLAARRRRSVTIAHKANVLTMTTGLFRDVCLEVGRGYPDIAVRTEHVDALAALLVRTPEAFDVIVAENMFGDILSDLTAELSGSLGMAPSINASATQAMAQAAHGSAPDIAGRDVANPIAMMLSSAMLLRWLGQRRAATQLARAADAIDGAVTAVVDAGVRTRDIGGSATTTEFTDAVVRALSSAEPSPRR